MRGRNPFLLLRRCARPSRLALLLTALCLATDVRAQRVATSLSADSVTVGERFFLSVVVERGMMEEPIFPVFSGDSTTLGDLQVIREVSRDSSYGGTARPGTRTDSLVYEVAAFAVDTAFVPPVLVRFTAAQDTFSIASQGSLYLPVISVVPRDATRLQELAPLAEFARPLWFWLMVLAGVLLLAAVLYFFWKKRQERPEPMTSVPAPPPLSPYDEAMVRLRELEATDLRVPEAIKGFYVDLSDVLRTYLARRLGTRAKERTTRELVQNLQQYAGPVPLPDEVTTRVRRVLELADFAKFADARPPVEAGQEALRETRTTLDLVETALRPKPAPMPEVAATP